MKYGPMSYYRLGTNYPRQRLRETYPAADRIGLIRRFYNGLIAPTPVGPTVYATLPGGITARALASPYLSPLLAGGVWYGLADDDTADPFITFQEVDEVDHETTGKPYWRITVYQVNFYADNNTTLHLIWEAWKKTFNFRQIVANPIVFADGVCFRIDSTGGHIDDDSGMVQSGKSLRRKLCEIACFQNRQYPV